jgi:hypothetical protein
MFMDDELPWREIILEYLRKYLIKLVQKMDFGRMLHIREIQQ